MAMLTRLRPDTQIFRWQLRWWRRVPKRLKKKSKSNNKVNISHIQVRVDLDPSFSILVVYHRVSRDFCFLISFNRFSFFIFIFSLFCLGFILMR
ncbi:hypothetical protein NC652_011473 [Populus alba x Populus x berolinensis]|nr:hypothetical protein NC652_011473 [Populus alba x Populus x berolinensis]